MSTGEAPTTGAPPPPRTRRGGRISRNQLRMGAVGALVALVVVFALVNLDQVRVDWIVTSSDTPLIVVIGVAFLAGAATGILLWRQRPRR